MYTYTYEGQSKSSEILWHRQSSSYRPDSVTGPFYVRVLQRMRDAVRRKRREKQQGQWFLHLDSAPIHASHVVQQFLEEINIPVITQPPYSPDLAPSDFWLFLTLKIGLKRTHFATIEEIESNASAGCRKIPKEAFRRCFQQWRKCVCVQRSYF
jgi:transposase